MTGETLEVRSDKRNPKMEAMAAMAAMAAMTAMVAMAAMAAMAALAAISNSNDQVTNYLESLNFFLKKLF